MKRVFLLASLLIAIVSPLAAFAAGTGTVTILYTGSIKGTLDPCLT